MNSQATVDTVDSFINLTRKSGLVEEPKLNEYVTRLLGDPPQPMEPRLFAAAMVRDGLLTNLQAGQLLKGKWRSFIISEKYKLLEHLGSGGMGSVYLCEHVLMRRRVALKVLPADKAKEPGFLERFHREARAVAALDHPNIVRAYDIDHEGSMHFLVMEFVDGSSLHEVVSRLGPFDPVRAAHYISQAAVGLQHAHEAGLVHRDVKPGNLLLDRQGTVKILDLGLAKFFREGGDELTMQSEPQTMLGTVDFISPEQALGEDVDIRADIYSLGATFYFLLTGHKPFEEGTIAQKLLAHQMRQPTPILEWRPEVPPEMAAVVEQMMAKNPDDRPGDPAEVVELLEEWTNIPIPAPPEEEMPSHCQAARGAPDDPTLRLPSSNSSPQLRRSGAPSSITRRSGPGSSARRSRRQRVPTIGALAVLGIALLIAGVTAVVWVVLSPPPLPPPPDPATAPVTTTTNPKANQPAKPTLAPFEVRRFQGSSQGLERLALSPDGRQFLTAGYDDLIRIWDVEKEKELGQLKGHTDWVHFVAYSHDGKRAVSAGRDESIRVWDLARKTATRTIGNQGKRIWGCDFSPDDRYVVSAGDDKLARLWDSRSGKHVRDFAGHEKPVNMVAFSPDGTRIATVSSDGTARLWDVSSGVELVKIAADPTHASAVAFDRTGRRLITGGADKTVRLWETDTGKLITELKGHTKAVYFVAIGPDDRHILSGGEDKTFRLWDPETRQLEQTFEGHDGAVTGLAFLPDGARCLSCSQDKTARLWRFEKPLPLPTTAQK
jgi:WD40 repeat protein